MNVAVNETEGQCYIYCFRVVVCEQIDIDMGPTNSVQRLFFFILAFIVLSMEKKQNIPVLTLCIAKMSGKTFRIHFTCVDISSSLR